MKELFDKMISMGGNVLEKLLPYITLENCVMAMVVVIVLFIFFFRRILVSSDRNLIHAIGMSLKYKDIAVVTSCFALLVAVKKWIFPHWESFATLYTPAIILVIALYLLWMLRRFVLVLKFDNRRKDTFNHLLQTLILLAIGAFIIYAIVHFGITEKTFLPFGFCAAVLGLIFNDSIRGVVAFFHLWGNNLLHIGDWIEVPGSNIDGIVLDITLVSVSVQNWDGTISSVAISLLQNGAFKNNQNMLDGKTSGRQMRRSFMIDARSIRVLDKGEVEVLKERLAKLGDDGISFSQYNENDASALNIHLFRLYLRHWLMNHPEVTRYPRLVVRLMEPTPEGIPLQVYTYIIKRSIMPYELVQSSIMEHIFLVMDWFHLNLFQKPSGEDITHFHHS